MSRRSNRNSSQQSTQKSQNLNITVETENDSSSSESPAYLVHQCVRYMLLNMGTNVPISKSQIYQHVLCGKNPGIPFGRFISNVTDIMRNMYGLEVDVMDNTANKKYIISSLLSHPELISDPKDYNMKEIVTFLVLAHIFMSGNVTRENDLWNFLKHFNITETTELDGIGNVDEFVKKTLFKQQYIMHTFHKAHRRINNEGKPKLSWGPHAEESVSKMEILKFYSNLFNRDPSTWVVQYEMAKEQTFYDPNNPISND